MRPAGPLTADALVQGQAPTAGQGKRRKRFKYVVTFESMTQPPLTLRSEGFASGIAGMARFAVKDARSQAKGQRWCSLVILLEKLEPEPDEVQR